MQWLCSLIGHHRSREEVQRYGDVLMSRCGRCHTRMVRDRPQHWRVASQEEVRALMPEPLYAPEPERPMHFSRT